MVAGRDPDARDHPAAYQDKRERTPVAAKHGGESEQKSQRRGDDTEDVGRVSLPSEISRQARNHHQDIEQGHEKRAGPEQETGVIGGIDQRFFGFPRRGSHRDGLAGARIAHSPGARGLIGLARCNRFKRSHRAFRVTTGLGYLSARPVPRCETRQDALCHLLADRQSHLCNTGRIATTQRGTRSRGGTGRLNEAWAGDRCCSGPD